MKHLTYKVIDRLFLVVFGAAGPTEDEWRSYLATVQRHGIDRTMQLVVTDGGLPTYAQRRDLSEVLAGCTVPVAVISGSRVFRSVVVIVAVISWSNRKLKAFPPSGLREAVAYLEIPERRLDLIRGELSKLRREIDESEHAASLGPP